MNLPHTIASDNQSLLSLLSPLVSAQPVAELGAVGIPSPFATLLEQSQRDNLTAELTPEALATLEELNKTALSSALPVEPSAQRLQALPPTPRVSSLGEHEVKSVKKALESPLMAPLQALELHTLRASTKVSDQEFDPLHPEALMAALPTPWMQVHPVAPPVPEESYTPDTVGLSSPSGTLPAPQPASALDGVTQAISLQALQPTSTVTPPPGQAAQSTPASAPSTMAAPTVSATPVQQPTASLQDRQSAQRPAPAEHSGAHTAARLQPWAAPSSVPMVGASQVPEVSVPADHSTVRLQPVLSGALSPMVEVSSAPPVTAPAATAPAATAPAATAPAVTAPAATPVTAPAATAPAATIYAVYAPGIYGAAYPQPLANGAVTPMLEAASAPVLPATPSSTLAAATTITADQRSLKPAPAVGVAAQAQALQIPTEAPSTERRKTGVQKEPTPLAVENPFAPSIRANLAPATQDTQLQTLAPTPGMREILHEPATRAADGDRQLPMSSPLSTTESGSIAAPQTAQITFQPPGNTPVPSVLIERSLYDAEFKEALATQVTVLVKDGVQQASLQLNPAHMGPVSIQISLDGTKAQVDFVADSALTRQIIEAGLPELASALREAGLTLSGGGVSQQSSPSQQQNPNNNPFQSRSQQQSQQPQNPEASVSTEPPNPSARSSRGSVDLYA